MQVHNLKIMAFIAISTIIESKEMRDDYAY